MGITIKDVASLSETSIATVSRVINNSPNVSAEIRRKVEDAIKQLNYIPNPAGRLLKSGGNKSILVVLPYRFSTFFGQIISAMTEQAIESGYTLMTCACNNDQNYERIMVDQLLKDTVNGFIFLGTFFDSYELNEINKRVPTVLCCEQVEKSELLAVVPDYKEGAKKAVREMINAGHKKIAYIAMRHRPTSSFLKHQGFSEALAENGIIDNEEYYFYGSHSLQTGYSAMKYFNCLDEKPTAVFAENDRIALGALNYAMQAGLDIGKEFVISGFDDLDICEMSTKKLTSVHQPLEDMGKKAVKALIEIIESGRENKGTITVPVELVRRDTL